MSDEAPPRNGASVYCKHCKCRIFSAGAAGVVRRQRILRLHTDGTPNPGFWDWFDVDDKMKFDNIACLNPHEAPGTEVTVQLHKEVGEGLGTQFVDEDELMLEELVEGGAAERSGLHAMQGKQLLRVNGTPIAHCDEIREITVPLDTVSLTFASTPQYRFLACAGCERDIIGATDGRTYFIAAKLVETGGGAAPNQVISAASPEGAQVMQMLQQQLAAQQQQ
eukprot:TRINITY_DN6964_c0_g7_i1.p1 TRINITY_DN6964_c0_g7~~TRINITY_DN6964_c0_g7_i1.p1  ORF type:complete len:222 (+),score=98.53 TRINITY_DN6964_c0_g7_i1:65-730(+)